jgi:hypothetical protein
MAVNPPENIQPGCWIFPGKQLVGSIADLISETWFNAPIAWARIKVNELEVKITHPEIISKWFSSIIRLELIILSPSRSNRWDEWMQDCPYI